MDEEVPVIKKVTHIPYQFKSLTPDELGDLIARIADDSGLPREIVFILHTNGWLYSHAVEEDPATWTKDV